MMKVEIIEDFSGFPDGPEGKEREFAKGETPDLGDDFAALIIKKGHAKALAAKSTRHAKAEEKVAE